MNLDFTFAQHMRMSSVKRWVIIEMSRAQSVAEHSFNVAVIANGLYSKLALDIGSYFVKNSKDHSVPVPSHGEFRGSILEWALMHDLPEVLTGDIPSPVKKHLNSAIDAMEYSVFPGYGRMRVSMKNTVGWWIVKIADYIDAIQFANRFCIDPKRAEIIAEMYVNLDSVIIEMEKKYGFPVRQAVEAVWQD